MFGIGGFELFLILLFGFLIFGPDKLPAMAKTLGKAIGKFKSAQEEMNKVVREEIYNPESDEPFKNPLETLSKAVEGKKSEEKPAAKTESFSERKARYDRERAARRAAEMEKAAEGTVGVSAAKLQNDTESKSKVSAEDVYGTNPLASSSQKTEESEPASASEPAGASKSASASEPAGASGSASASEPAGASASVSESAPVGETDARGKDSAKAISSSKPAQKTPEEKAAARSAAAKKAAATRAANRKAAAEAQAAKDAEAAKTAKAKTSEAKTQDVGSVSENESKGE